MHRRQYHEAQKQQLVQQIQQQRLDLTASKSLWLEKTERIDHGWQMILGLRKCLLVGSSLVALYGVRHPSKLIRWSRRAVGLWKTVRLTRHIFSQK